MASRQGKRELHHLGRFHRAGNLASAQDIPRPGVEAKIQEPAFHRHVFVSSHAHPDNVIADGPVGRNQQLDVVNIELVRVPGLDP